MTSLDHERIEETFAASNTTVPLKNRSIGRRNVIAGLGALGIAGGFGVSRVLAQDSTPTATTDDGADVGSGDDTETDETILGDEIAAKYQDFLAKLAANLGEPDPTVVDAAIREALKAMVDDKFNAGEISANLQTELKARIDSSEVPIRVGMGPGFSERRGNREERGEPEDDGVGGDESDETEDESVEDAASATPAI